MSDMRELAENQGGVIYIEQFEEWVESVVEQLENMTTVCSAGTFINGGYIGRNKAIEIVRKGGVNE